MRVAIQDFSKKCSKIKGLAQSVNIIAFDYQVDTIEKYCWGDVHTISIDEVERVYRLSRQHEINKSEPFKTKSGKYVDINTKCLKV